MKQCPACKTVYDDALKFCLADGTALPLAQSGPEQVGLTVALPGLPKSPPVYVLAGAGLLLAGFAGAMLMRSPDSLFSASAYHDVNPTGAQVLPAKVDITQPGQIAVAPIGSSEATEDRRGVVERELEVTRQQIADRIGKWERAAESRDLDDYMSQYWDVVNYYKRPGATKGFVRNDKQRAFAKFGSIEISIDIVSIAVSPNGVNADATIDKGWLFQEGGYSAGKVRQRIELVLIGDEWLISGEKDLKVFYTGK